MSVRWKRSWKAKMPTSSASMIVPIAALVRKSALTTLSAKFNSPAAREWEFYKPEIIRAM